VRGDTSERARNQLAAAPGRLTLSPLSSPLLSSPHSSRLVSLSRLTADTSDKLPALDDAKSTRTAREKKKAALEALLALSAEEYVELAFEASSFSIWDSADEVRD